MPKYIAKPFVVDVEEIKDDKGTPTGDFKITDHPEQFVVTKEWLEKRFLPAHKSGHSAHS